MIEFEGMPQHSQHYQICHLFLLYSLKIPSQLSTCVKFSSKYILHLATSIIWLGKCMAMQMRRSAAQAAGFLPASI